MTGLFLDLTICAVIAAIIMLSVVAVGRLVDMFDGLLMIKLSDASGRGIARFILNRVMFMGVVFHELSHALLAILTGAHVTKISCFVLFSKDKLGYVNFETYGGKIKQAIQRCLVSCAPVLTGFITIPIFALAVLNPGYAIWAKLIFGYIAISILCHMSMSKADLDLYAKGSLFAYPVLIGIVLVAKYLFF